MLSPLLLLLLTLLLPYHPTHASNPSPSLTIETLTPAATPCSSRTTRSGDTISVHYRGTLAADGSPFDASYDRGVPLTFEVGKGRVIAG
jgi:FK506-binding protein 2